MPEISEVMELNRYREGEVTDDPGLVRALARRKASFGAASVLFYDRPIRMARAEGAWMYDAEDRPYLDLYNNVPCIGHSHPAVAEAIARQAGVLNTNTRYLVDIVHDYAERLLSEFPGDLSNVVLTCTGSESNDLALRMAEAMTGRRGVIVTEFAYHGNSASTTAISPGSRPDRSVPDHIRTVPPPEAFRSGDADPGATFAGAVRAAIADLEAAGHGISCLVVDTIFSSDGVYCAPPGLIAAAVAAVQDAGGLFIADEVQPGFGRTGTGMWGYKMHAVRPDMVTMGKPMGNGFPMSGIVARPDIVDRFSAQGSGYFNTFGGNPLAAAAGLAVLETIHGEGLMENARAMGEHLRAGLRGLQGEGSIIGDVRGAGLFIGVEISVPGTREPDAAAASALINGLRSRGVMVGATGPYGNVLKIRPPLCFTASDAAFFLSATEEVAGSLGKAA
ncbi:4-aminobutyrate aminotransferase-like enzyme [Palleronia aestuarii]|uniref:4-aminobutyrate aminotransferase-like enzyme n=1 Tax=Palleronia aestuarii TaxID=568105 RepID=A0A2W7N3E3_9RHOB|nr:aminotransferase class III-fold pyridoxal phosphate-dependent enzyme [Palleronia aestuarii]PZX12877.1 4-aminobutyrate aminotransferase-like enzyme [Palleronia aestuarii]